MSREVPPLPDPRPHLAPGESRLTGWRCSQCGHPVALAAPWCPVCRGALAPEAFGPEGTVWSSTVFRVPLQDRTPPWALVYADLDDGPRVLAHLSGQAHRLHVGVRVRLVGESESGDLLVEEVDA